MSFSGKLTEVIDWFYIKPFRKVLSIQKFRYAVCGGVNLIFGWVLFYIFYHYLYDGEMVNLGFAVVSPHIAASYSVFPITFLTGFWLQGNISFKSSPLRNYVQFGRYLISVTGSVILNYFILKFFVEVIHFYPTPSQMLTSMIVVVYSYLMQKYYSFRGCLDQ